MRPGRPLVAVFGSSEPVAGEPAYETAREVGRLLASEGYGVVTGGYGGVMEGASHGAAEAGGHVVGVTSAIFSAREPNPFVSERRETADLVARMGALVDEASAFIVLPGKSGTLAELTLLWALHRAGSLARPAVVLLGAVWTPFLRHLVASDMIESEQLAVTRVAEDPKTAVALVAAALRAEDRGGE